MVGMLCSSREHKTNKDPSKNANQSESTDKDSITPG